MLKLKNKNGGFTLIELLVVIAIIGVISSVVLASLSDSRSRAEEAKVLTEKRSMQNSFAIYYTNSGFFPDPGNVGLRNCIGQNPCMDAGDEINPLDDGDFSGLAFDQKNNLTDYLANIFVNTANAQNLSEVINRYPDNTPLVVIDSLEYSGPFYVCDEANDDDKCTSASILWTTEEPDCGGNGAVVNGLTGRGGSLCKDGAASSDSEEGSF